MESLIIPAGWLVCLSMAATLTWVARRVASLAAVEGLIPVELSPKERHRVERHRRRGQLGLVTRSVSSCGGGLSPSDPSR